MVEGKYFWGRELRFLSGMEHFVFSVWGCCCLSCLTAMRGMGGFSPPQGAARNPEDMDRERREHEREERMGQLRGSATRALPPGPPAGATANRLRNVTEPMASTPTSRIQQSGEWGGRAGGGCLPHYWLKTETID